MRHKYGTRGIVLSRTLSGEANVSVTLLTPDLGLVRARAQGLRRPGAKLSAALSTFAESEVVLVRGKENWRVAGAVLEENWFTRLEHAEPRARAGRVSGLLLRLVAGEVHEPALFPVIREFFAALTNVPDSLHEAAEMLAALRILAALGLDTGTIPGDTLSFTSESLADVAKNRTSYIARINHGINASEL